MMLLALASLAWATASGDDRRGVVRGAAMTGEEWYGAPLRRDGLAPRQPIDERCGCGR